MDFEQLNKDERVKSTVKHLANKFGENNFKIRDYWDGDLCAIGLTDKEEKYLVYFSTYGDKGFYVSLENSKSSDDLPYEPIGDFHQLDLEGLEKIFKKHLRL